MKKAAHTTDESVKTGLKIESDKPTQEELLKKDPDELSHELVEDQPEPIQPTEKDVDDLIHSQRPTQDYDLNKEQDIDDLLHEPIEPDEEEP